MRPAARMALFAAGLSVVFAASFGVGRAVAPDETTPRPVPTHPHDAGTGGP